MGQFFEECRPKILGELYVPWMCKFSMKLPAGGKRWACKLWFETENGTASNLKERFDTCQSLESFLEQAWI
jgi:hypothetical protein